MRGSASSARAKATSCRCPAESWTPRSPTWVSIPSGRAATNSLAPTVADRLLDFLEARLRASEGDVLPHAAGEEEPLLRDDPKLATQRQLLDAAQVVTVDLHPAFLGVVKARHQLREGRLAGPGRPDQGKGLAGRDVQVDFPQRPLDLFTPLLPLQRVIGVGE